MNNEVPKVKSKVGSQVETTKVSGAINVVIPGNFPSGDSRPTLVRGIDELYKKFGVTSAPSAEDDPALLQAASILGVYPVWVVRTHKNVILEGLTDSGEKVFFDESHNLIKHRVNVTINISSSIYDDMFIECGDNVYYVGKLPEDVSASTKVKLNIESPTYDKFFNALQTTPEVYANGDLFYVTNNNGYYSIYSKNPITKKSTSLVEKSSTTVSMSKLNFGQDDFNQSCYVLINDTAYVNEGVSPTAYVYPGTVERLHFVNEADSQSASAFAIYLFDALLGSANKKYLSVNQMYLDRTFSNTNIKVTSNIDSLKYNQGNILMSPNSEDAKGKYLVLTLGDKSVVIHNNANLENLELTPDYEEYNLSCNSVYRLVEHISEKLISINEYLEEGIIITDVSNYCYYLNDGQMVSFSYSFPTQGSSTVTDESLGLVNFGNKEFNDSNVKMDFGGISIDKAEYVIGNANSASLTKNKVVISDSPMNLNDYMEKLTRALPSSYNASYENNVLSLFISTDETIKVNSEGDLSQTTKDINYVGIENGNTFAVVLNFNSKAKVANFNWVWDNDEELYELTVRVNGAEYTRKIQFKDSTRVDGFGSSLYYDAFNKNFDYVTLVKIGDERTLSEYSSPSFGNSVPIMEPNVSDLQVALNQLSRYKFTKFEIMLDGGFVNPAYINVMDSICSKIKAVLYSGTVPSRFVSDIVEFRNQCPVNSWNTYLATPRIADTSLGQFTVYQSPAVQYVKRILNNSKVMDEFEAVFGADKGAVSGTPEFDFDPETDQEELIRASVNTVYHSKEVNITYFNDNYTLVNQKMPMQEECIVRMINAAAHVAEMWLEINALGRKNTMKLRDTVRTGVKTTIENRLLSNTIPYKDLEVVCDESNGNVDGSETLYVSASCRPYGSVHTVELFTLAKTLSSTEE